MAPPPSLSLTLRELREARGLTLGELAHLAGVSASSLQGWESGRQVPRGGSLARTLDALETPSRVRARLLSTADPRYARFALVKNPLGAPIDVGTVLRAMRARRGLTQADLARSVGLTQGAVAKWENGESIPPPSTVHTAGFALGATVEETLALAAAQGGIPDGLPDEPCTVKLPDDLSLELQEMVSLAYEAELWRRAAADAHWQPVLAGVLAYRANLYVLQRRMGEVEKVAHRAIRLATNREGKTMAVPAVNALTELGRARGESPAAAARLCGEWAAGLSNSVFRSWMLGAQGMNLVLAGKSREGIDLVVRARDMDEEIGAFGPEGETYPGQTRAQSLAEAYLAAGEPSAAADALAPFRCPNSFQILYARVEHANRRRLDDASLAYLRHAVRGFAGNRSRKNLQALECVEREQARLSGETEAAGGEAALVEGDAESHARRLWAGVSGARRWLDGGGPS